MDFGANVRKLAFGALAVSSFLAGSSATAHARAARSFGVINDETS